MRFPTILSCSATKDVNLAAVQNHELVHALSFCHTRLLPEPSSGGSARRFEERDIEMKISSITVIAILTTMSPTTLLADTPQTYRAEGVKAHGAGSWNPPNPKDLCDGAKKDAIDKAASAGFKGSERRQRLPA